MKNYSGEVSENRKTVKFGDVQSNSGDDIGVSGSFKIEDSMTSVTVGRTETGHVHANSDVIHMQHEDDPLTASFSEKNFDPTYRYQKV
jgi:hypothetical protein